MKTILVPVENNDAMQSALETALLLARSCGSYIEGFPLRWEITDLGGGDIAGAFPLTTYEEDLAEDEQQARRIFESYMQRHDVPQSTATTNGLSFAWLNSAPEGANFVGNYGRVFDVIVMSRPDRNSTHLHKLAIEFGLFESGRPILLAPPSPPRQIATNVLIAWNCSTEQTRATALAMPLLQIAERVTVLTVIGGAAVPGPSADQIIRYLQLNGIVAEPIKVELDGRSTGETILATANSLGCDLLIKGAYTQSWLRQIIFGGATRHVLKHAAIPVLLAN